MKGKDVVHIIAIIIVYALISFCSLFISFFPALVLKVTVGIFILLYIYCVSAKYKLAKLPIIAALVVCFALSCIQIDRNNFKYNMFKGMYNDCREQLMVEMANYPDGNFLTSELNFFTRYDYVYLPEDIPQYLIPPYDSLEQIEGNWYYVKWY